MGILKKIKKKKEKEDYKRVVGISRAEVGRNNIMGAKNAEAKLPQIERFCHAYWTPIFYYISRKEFKFGTERLKRLEEGIAHMWEVLVNPEWLTMADLEEGLVLECDVTVPRYKRKEIPTTPSVDGFTAMYALNAHTQTLENLRTVWIWVLHDKFGFNKARLERALRVLEHMSKVSSKEYQSILDFVEHGRGIDLAWARNTLAKIG